MPEPTLEEMLGTMEIEYANASLEFSEGKWRCSLSTPSGDIDCVTDNPTLAARLCLQAARHPVNSA